MLQRLNAFAASFVPVPQLGVALPYFSMRGGMSQFYFHFTERLT